MVTLLTCYLPPVWKFDPYLLFWALSLWWAHTSCQGAWITWEDVKETRRNPPVALLSVCRLHLHKVRWYRALCVHQTMLWSCVLPCSDLTSQSHICWRPHLSWAWSPSLSGAPYCWRCWGSGRTAAHLWSQSNGCCCPPSQTRKKQKTTRKHVRNPCDSDAVKPGEMMDSQCVRTFPQR